MRIGPRLPEWILHTGNLAVALSPVLFGRLVLAMVDAPNAIARTIIGARLLADPAADRFFELHVRLVPNMPLDLWGLALSGILGAEGAVTAFAALCIFGIYVAVQRLHHAVYGETSALIGSCSVCAVYGFSLTFGFLNYLLGLALVIWAMARFETWRREPAGRAFGLSQAALLSGVFLCSLIPIIVYGVYVAIRTLQEIEVWAMLRRNVAAHLPSGIAILALLASADVAPPWAAQTAWSMVAKMASVHLNLLPFGGSADTPMAVTLGARFLGLVTFALFVRLFWTRALAIAQPLRFTVFGLFGLVLVMPTSLSGVAFVDSRLLEAALLVGVACSQADQATQKQRHATLALLALLCLAKPIVASGQAYAALAKASRVPSLAGELPEGSVIAVTLGDNARDALARPHLLLTAVEHRESLLLQSVFPNYFLGLRSDAPIGLYPFQVPQSHLGKRQMCAGLTHVVVVGNWRPYPADLPIEFTWDSGDWALFRVRTAGSKGNGPVCDFDAKSATDDRRPPAGH